MGFALAYGQHFSPEMPSMLFEVVVIMSTVSAQRDRRKESHCLSLDN